MDGRYCKLSTLPRNRSLLRMVRPRYALFELPAEDIRRCLELTSRAIVISSWLAAVARRELTRFKEFISWLNFGNSFRYYPRQWFRYLRRGSHCTSYQ